MCHFGGEPLYCMCDCVSLQSQTGGHDSVCTTVLVYSLSSLLDWTPSLTEFLWLSHPCRSRCHVACCWLRWAFVALHCFFLTGHAWQCVPRFSGSRVIYDNNNNNNNNNNCIQRRSSRFSTISLLRHELSPNRTLKWRRHNSVKIKCNTPKVYHVQRVVCHLVWRDSSAIKFDRVEITFILALLHWLKPLTDKYGLNSNWTFLSVPYLLELFKT